MPLSPEELLGEVPPPEPIPASDRIPVESLDAPTLGLVHEIQANMLEAAALEEVLAAARAPDANADAHVAEALDRGEAVVAAFAEVKAGLEAAEAQAQAIDAEADRLAAERERVAARVRELRARVR